MKEVWIKKKVPESKTECGNTPCNECIFDCDSHADSLFILEG